MPPTTLPSQLQKENIIATWIADGLPSTDKMADMWSARTGIYISKNQIVRSLYDACTELGYGGIGDYKEAYLASTKQTLSDTNPNEPHSARVRETENGLHASSVSTDIRSIDDLVAACQIDLTYWKIDRQHCKTHQVSRSDVQRDLMFDEGKITGHIIDQGDMRKVALFSVEGWFSPREEKPYEDTAVKLIEEGYRQKKQTPVVKNYPAGDHMGVLGQTDVHYNRLSLDGTYSHEQTTHDLLLTAEVALGRMKSLVPTLEKIVLIAGSDLINTDNFDGTTQRGTWQELAGSQTAAIDAAVDGQKRLIGMAVEVAPVEIVIIPGNHDYYSTYFLGKVLEAWAENHRFTKYITVTHSKSPRQYVEYGTNLIGFTHGNDVKHDKLPGLMAIEQREAWGRTRWYTWLTGHYHSSKEVYYPTAEHHGVSVVTLPALCPPDYWEHQMGYVGVKRAAEGRLYHREHGPSAVFPIFVDELK